MEDNRVIIGSRELDEQTSTELRAVSMATGRSVEEIILSAIDTAIGPYRNEKGKVTLNPALLIGEPLWDGNASDPIPCYVIKKTKIYGQPYMIILVNGQILSVPEKKIKYS